MKNDATFVSTEKDESSEAETGKTFWLDTSTIVEDSGCILSMADDNNHVKLHASVIDELDSLSKRGKYNAREALRILEVLGANGCLAEGVLTDDGGTVQITHCDEEWKGTVPDHKILLAAKKNQEGKVVTLDRAMRIKANCLKIPHEEFKNIKVNLKELYKGYKEINLENELVEQIKQSKGKQISVCQLPDGLFSDPLFENEFVFVDNNPNIILRHSNNMLKVIPPANKVFSLGPKPGNFPQHCAWNLLFDPSIILVTLWGIFGSGKTLLAVVSALAQLKGFMDCGCKKIYDRVIFISPIGDQTLGLLPGDKFEKIFPWVQPMFDNWKVLHKSSNGVNRGEGENEKGRSFNAIMEKLKSEGIIELESVEYLKGRTLHNSFVVVDEAEDFSRDKIVKIASRGGEDSKIVFTGDPSQISAPYLKEDNNGLVYFAEIFKEDSEAGSVCLTDVERSKLAKLIARRCAKK